MRGKNKKTDDTMENKSFLGKGWSFPPEFGKTDYPTAMVKEETDIRQSLEILLRTRPGTYVHRYDYGCALNDFVFEEMSVTAQALMRDKIETAILYFEPRITLNGLRFDLEQAHQGVMLIEIDYTVRRTNRRDNLVFPFYLREGTNIHL